jgi:hypothetical protein
MGGRGKHPFWLALDAVAATKIALETRLSMCDRSEGVTNTIIFAEKYQEKLI